MTPQTSRSSERSEAAADVLAAALALAARDWPVFPCDGKRPRTENGLLGASIDKLKIERWWTRIWPAANIGVRTGAESGLLVLDVDPGHGGDDALAELERQHGELPATAEVLTGGGGRHIYFAHPGGDVRNTASRLGHGLDTRGDGGYVIAPPSRHASGNRYEWSVDGHPDDVPLAAAPDWLLKVLQAPEPRRNGAASNGHGDAIPEGRRNPELASLAGTMRRRGLDEAAIGAALQVTNTTRCRPPLPSAEVDAIAASIARYEPANPPADESYAVRWTDDKTPKLILPDNPEHDDLAGQLAWLTCVLRFDPQHPATGAAHEGRRGQDGHVEIRRAGTAPVRFEPASAINTARRFTPALGWQLLPTDGEPYGFKDAHCSQIAHVLRLACGIDAAPTAEQEAAAIVGTFTLSAKPIEDRTTYGTPQQRHEAVEALRPELDEHSGRQVGAARYLIDDATGELAIRVGDLQDAARRHVGASLPHGWLDARMTNLGWARVTLRGHAFPGREGRKGPCSRCDVYRGHLPSEPADDGSVRT